MESLPVKIPYHIRQVEYRDIPRVVDVATAAWMDDEFYAHIMPKRRENPLAWRENFASLLRRRLVEKGAWAMVCVGSPHAYDHDKIMGYAIWERHPGTSTPGSSEAEKQAATRADEWYPEKSGWMDAIERMLISAADNLDMTLRLNPATDYAALKAFQNANDNEEFGPLLAGVRHWHLAGLAVDPQHWRKGVASALISWGLGHAEEESKTLGYSVPVTLIASATGNKVYRAFGFECIDWVAIPAWDQMGESGRAFVWDPYGTWIEKAPSGTMAKGKKVDVVWTKRVLEMVSNDSK